MDIQKRVLELLGTDNNKLDISKEEEKQELIVLPEEKTQTEEIVTEENLQARKELEQKTLDENVQNVIQKTYDKNVETQIVKDEILQATQEVTERKIKAELVKDMLVVMSEEQKNELAQYYLECEKKTLAYRRKKEKKIIIEEVSAELQKRKFNALWLRYGYMYKDEKSFVPNKLHNIGKEIANWWNGASDNFKRIVKGTMKLVFWGVIIYLFFKYGIKILKLIPENININT